MDAEEDEHVDNPEELDLPDEGHAVIAKARPEKKTQTARNREKRRREAEEAAEAKRSLKQQRRELDGVKELQSEIAAQEAADAARAARKAVNLAEKALSRPPRLGKHKFKPASIQVSGVVKFHDSHTALRTEVSCSFSAGRCCCLRRSMAACAG